MRRVRRELASPVRLLRTPTTRVARHAEVVRVRRFGGRRSGVAPDAAPAGVAEIHGVPSLAQAPTSSLAHRRRCLTHRPRRPPPTAAIPNSQTGVIHLLLLERRRQALRVIDFEAASGARRATPARRSSRIGWNGRRSPKGDDRCRRAPAGAKGATGPAGPGRPVVRLRPLPPGEKFSRHRLRRRSPRSPSPRACTTLSGKAIAYMNECARRGDLVRDRDLPPGAEVGADGTTALDHVADRHQRQRAASGRRSLMEIA